MSGSGLSSRPSTVPLDAYAEKFSGSGVSNSSSRRKRSFDMDSLRKDVYIDDVDIDDFAAALSAPSKQFNPGASTVSQQPFAPGASSASSFAMMQSYVNFSDSMVSSVSTQSTVKQDNTFSAAMGAATHKSGYGSSPQAKMSIFSNDSENSFDGDSSGWFKARSKTVVSTEGDGSEPNDVESQSYELGPLGVTKSAFSRDSMDSYGHQSTAHFATSRVDFNARSRVTDNGSDDGGYYPSRRRRSGSSNQSSNQSFLSAHSDDSASYYDVDKVRRDEHPNTLTL